MSDEDAKRWKFIDRNLKRVQPKPKDMTDDDWHKFLRSVKGDTDGLETMEKLFRKSESRFIDSVKSRLSKYRAGSNTGRKQQAKKEECTQDWRL